MSYPNNPEPPRPDPFIDPDETVRRQETRYQDGSVDRRVEEDRLYIDRSARDNENAARGLLVGIIAACLVGLGLVAWYLLNQRDEQPQVQPVIVPQQQSPSSPPQSSQSPPDINITVPNASPVPQSPPDVNTNITVPSPASSPPASTAPTINNNIAVPSPETRDLTSPAPSTPTNDSMNAPTPGASASPTTNP
jgi:hypothetical protein